MSYVLDALRRAEADRQRGQVPHLHAPAAVGAAAAPAAAGPARPGWLRWGLLAMLVALAAAGGWWWAGGSGTGPQSSAPAAPDASTPEAAAAPRAAAPVSPRVAEVPPPVALPEPGSARSSTARRPVDATTPPPAALPMAFGGAFDSPDPKARMLIINGQVWREGDEPVPGWVLERIGLHAARFSAQGRPVEIDYAGGAPR